VTVRINGIRDRSELRIQFSQTRTFWNSEHLKLKLVFLLIHFNFKQNPYEYLVSTDISKTGAYKMLENNFNENKTYENN